MFLFVFFGWLVTISNRFHSTKLFCDSTKYHKNLYIMDIFYDNIDLITVFMLANNHSLIFRLYIDLVIPVKSWNPYKIFIYLVVVLLFPESSPNNIQLFSKHPEPKLREEDLYIHRFLRTDFLLHTLNDFLSR